MGVAETSRKTRGRGGTLGAQGRKRMIELAVAAEAERKALEADLLSGLNREPIPIDRVAAELLSASIIRSPRQRMSGKNDCDERKNATQLIRATGLRPPPPAAAAAPSLQAQLAARGYMPPADDDCVVEIDDETATSEVSA